MNRIRLLGLGLRMSVAGGRTALVRLLLMSVGLAVGATLLLGGLSVGPALNRYERRATSRTGVVAYNVHPQPADATLTSWFSTRFEGQDITLLVVRGVGDAPVPPGIPRLPGPDQLFASPALARLLADSGSASLLRPRIPGQMFGQIAPEGLLQPDELFAYLGASLDLNVPPSFMQPVIAFEPSPKAGRSLDVTALVLLCLAVLAILIPITLFVLTATRLSAATREARLAAVRLAGATQAQVRLLAATENAVPGIVGAALAYPLFLLSRGGGTAALAAIQGHGFFVSDFSPPTFATVALLLGLPLFAVGVAIVGMRQVVVSPLGIVRRSRRIRRGLHWPIVLVAGLLGLGIVTVERHRLLRVLPNPLPGVVIAVVLLAILVGLAGSAQWLGWLSARAFGRRAPTSVLLGARRLEAEPTSAGRVVVSIAVLVAFAAIGEAIFLQASSLNARYGKVPGLRSTDVVAQPYTDYPERLKIWDQVRSVPGVRGLSVSNSLSDLGTCGRECIGVIRTDGDSATVERIRNAVGLLGTVETAAEARASDAPDDSGVARALLAGMILILAVTAANLLLSTVDGMMERRRPLAILSAIGVPASIIRRSVLFQVALPLAIALALGGSVGLAVTALVFTIADEPIFLPVAPLLFTAAAAGAAALIVTASSLPWVRLVRRPELLRSE